MVPTEVTTFVLTVGSLVFEVEVEVEDYLSRFFLYLIVKKFSSYKVGQVT
jgi:hypothetical protein